MKVPKYIEDALTHRARAAETWEKYDRMITDFINRHEIDVPAEEYCGGVEGIVHPWESADIIRECIEKHKNIQSKQEK